MVFSWLIMENQICLMYERVEILSDLHYQMMNKSNLHSCLFLKLSTDSRNNFCAKFILFLIHHLHIIKLFEYWKHSIIFIDLVINIFFK